MKPQKRIQSITIKRMLDTNPDTSSAGGVRGRHNNNYSIDRAHAIDCPQQSFNRGSKNILIVAQDEIAEEANVCTCGGQHLDPQFLPVL